ncbi:sterile alpha motif domain-containing protein 1-like [Equus asinus]|uniref:sterile alpha motif domain-containing protein 1-like n=1 Tax=Equus asinus TaxID=9793 RepID=UPI001D05896B|nr:atherin-like isoform X2 [Equus asinus]XP_044605536.1 atherin-like isoform X2 [Equus asinus]XP_044605538.1 atherin-like isoform X2 [Equus asinus]
MAGPGAPSRPPRRRLTGRPVAAPALRRGPRSATSPPGDLPGSARLPRAAASTAAPAGAHRPRPLPPGPRVRRGAMRGAAGAAIRAEGAAWGQRAPRARPSPPPEPQGACAAGAGRTCVCLCRSRTGGRARGHSLNVLGTRTCILHLNPAHVLVAPLDLQKPQ